MGEDGEVGKHLVIYLPLKSIDWKFPRKDDTQWASMPLTKEELQVEDRNGPTIPISSALPIHPSPSDYQTHFQYPQQSK